MKPNALHTRLHWIHLIPREVFCVNLLSLARPDRRAFLWCRPNDPLTRSHGHQGLLLARIRATAIQIAVDRLAV